MRRSFYVSCLKCVTAILGIFSFLYLTKFQEKSGESVNIWKTPDILNDVPNNLTLLSHHLENLCKYPVLKPNDPSISGYVRHPKRLLCKKVQPEFTSMDKDGDLYVHEDISEPSETKNPACFYRAFAGSLKPQIQRTEWIGPWNALKPKKDGSGIWIPEDQFLVKCYHPDDKDKRFHIYKNAYAHFGDRRAKNFERASKDRVSLNMLILDSMSLNQFKRHMPKSWTYMTKVMEFEWLEGYNKVADNSMVNLLPVLTGLRYQNQSKHMISDILPHSYETTQLELESLPFIWKIFQKANCVTMLNDDIGNPNRGLFHYPFNQTKGWSVSPTDFYFRPFYVSNYRWPVENSSKFCFGNHALPEIHLGLLEDFIYKFQEKCHFSFNFLTDMSHGDPNYIETMDEDLRNMIERLFTRNQLEHSALVIMGDHGNRMNSIGKTFIGTLEERLPLFSLYLPSWLKQEYPHIIHNLRINRKRLTSNFDVHQTLVDIAAQKFANQLPQRTGRGQSLFSPISSQRCCTDAGIPEHFCTCLEPGRKINEEALEVRKSTELLRRWLVSQKPHLHCVNTENFTVELLEYSSYVPSQMVRHGIREQTPKNVKLLQAAKAAMEIEYIEITVRFASQITLRSRFQNERLKPERLTMNVEPLIVAFGSSPPLSPIKRIENFCNSI